MVAQSPLPPQIALFYVAEINLSIAEPAIASRYSHSMEPPFRHLRLHLLGLRLVRQLQYRQRPSQPLVLLPQELGFQLDGPLLVAGWMALMDVY